MASVWFGIPVAGECVGLGVIQLRCRSNRLIDVNLTSVVKYRTSLLFTPTAALKVLGKVHSATPKELRNSTWQLGVLTLLPDWNADASTSDFVSEFGGFHPVLLEACS